ncbi:hypothetical protein [Pseudomonas rubra]|uniref:Uncharacterized protein n=1 Tax=Pseudomonas rubra TaxID=2942627 RepID=A0ABT5PC15_9PSED|nr:hypothetical protein [Pseudomonas rubra]MDD1015849.1 hypothetical protein [Pseudomonas rubra]MDD1036772.1 hypothetical protein [Pseudomonas rubra]MDD1157261.1 hypothetical protein [Pseudomonas rubra]
MNTHEVMDKGWQVQASTLPAALLSAMASGLDTGALSLSPAHVRNLNAYVAYARGLPSSPTGIARWTGASAAAADFRKIPVDNSIFASNPELNNNSMLTFFSQVKRHASGWEVLFGTNLQLASALVTAAGSINHSGTVILEVCAQTKALGKRREAWDALQGGELLPLSAADQKIVLSLPNQMSALKAQLRAYAQQVESVRIQGTRFRDEARLQLLPAVVRKTKEIGQYLHPTLQTTMGFMGVVARLKSRVEELLEELQKMDKLLREVLTAASHVHSAWQSLTLYIDTSNTQLQRITTGQQLARFAIYFGRFLGLWKTIEDSAKHMVRTLTQCQRRT